MSKFTIEDLDREEIRELPKKYKYNEKENNFIGEEIFKKAKETGKHYAVEVYFESRNHAELVATFQDENTYIKCLPVLELIAKENNFIITESIKDE